MLNEKAHSKSQQRLMGMVYAYKSGKLELDDLPSSLSKKIKDIADGTKKKTGDRRKKTKGIDIKSAKDYASTKHKGLPEKVKEHMVTKFDQFINEGLFGKNYTVTITELQLGIKVTYHFNENGIIEDITGEMYDEYAIEIGEKLTWDQISRIVKGDNDLKVTCNKQEAKNILMYGKPIVSWMSPKAKPTVGGVVKTKPKIKPKE